MDPVKAFSEVTPQELENLRNDIKRRENNIERMLTDIKHREEDISHMKTDIRRLEEECKRMRFEVSDMEHALLQPTALLLAYESLDLAMKREKRRSRSHSPVTQRETGQQAGGKNVKLRYGLPKRFK